MNVTLPLKNCIRVWESDLFHKGFLMSPSTRVIIEATIKYLKELKAIKDSKDPELLQGKFPE